MPVIMEDIGGMEEDLQPDDAMEVANRTLAVPPTVSEAVRRKHEETSTPYCNWCPYCVGGQKNDDAHSKHPTGRGGEGGK